MTEISQQAVEAAFSRWQGWLATPFHSRWDCPERMRSALEAALPHLAVLPAPPPPFDASESLDDVLADIKAMGWRIDGIDPRDASDDGGWQTSAYSGELGENIFADGETIRSCLIALRTAIRASTDGRDA